MRQRQSIKALYGSKQYLDAYAEHTDLRVAEDPQEAVGGLWDTLGLLQLDYLVANRLRPNHSLLDVGCGTLRAGRHFIRYLDAERYSGFELSPKALDFAHSLIEREGLADKMPTLTLNKSRTLCFPELNNQFDYLLAQSVFTHLMPEHIEECFAHVGKLMHEQSLFFFTFGESAKLEQRSEKGFQQPFSFFEGLAATYGFCVERRNDYDHPRGQIMALLSRPPR